MFGWFRRILPGIKASFSFDLHEIVFDSDPIEAGPPLWMEGKCVQMNIAKNLNRFSPATVQKFNIIYYNLPLSIYQDIICKSVFPRFA